MKRNSNDEKQGTVRVELKYCEHCGGLFVRECGAGVVYCNTCQPKVADLPIPKKRPSYVKLPVRRPALVDEYEVEIESEAVDMEAVGGAA
jgi:hypothetical protein